MTSITAGTGLTGGTITTTGTIAADTSYLATLGTPQTFTGSKTFTGGLAWNSRFQYNTAPAEIAFETTAAKYVLRTRYGAGDPGAGTSRLIPQAIMDNYCGDYDGCNLTLSMRFWTGIEAEKAARGPYKLYYDVPTRRWRLSETDAAGIDGSGGIEHVLKAWACYVTDGAYSAFNPQGDPGVGMSLLIWNEYVHSNLECEVIIED